MNSCPEIVSNYQKENRLSDSNLLCVFDNQNGVLELQGDFYSNLNLDLKGTVLIEKKISELIISLQKGNIHFFPEFNLIDNINCHLHVIQTDNKVWVFANRNLNEKHMTTKSVILESEQPQSESEQLQEMLKMKDQFLNIIAHDFRSPITNVIEGVSIVQNNLFKIDGISDFDKEIINCVREELILLLNYTNKLNNWTKLDLETDESKFETFSIENLFSSVEISLRNLLEDKNIGIIWKCDSALSYTTDMSLFKMAIYNLIENAIKFSPENELITIEARPEFIKISDNGFGISDEKLNMIRKGYLFKNNKITGKCFGPGLGLNVVTRIFASLKYAFEIESKVGMGTTITIKIK